MNCWTAKYFIYSTLRRNQRASFPNKSMIVLTLLILILLLLQSYSNVDQKQGLTASTISHNQIRENLIDVLEQVEQPLKEIRTLSAGEELERLSLAPELAQADMLLVIYTFDSPEQNVIRDTARKTWMHHLLQETETIRVLFFVGLGGREVESNVPIHDPQWILAQEQQQYHDIVFLDHYESYQGLSQKMIKMYQWLAEQQDRLLPNLQWVFKCDTDAYLYVPEFRKLASDIRKMEAVKTMVGRTIKRSPVIREGPWTNMEYEMDKYPTYMAGAGYWISTDLIKWIGWNARKGWLSVMPNEDALLGVWLLGLNVRYLNDHRIQTLGGDHEMKMDAIPRKDCYPWAVYHNLNLAGILDTHRRIEMCGSPCVICSH